jgi:hypothetical protein
MRFKRLAAVAILIFVTAGSNARPEIQRRIPCDDGSCSSGEYMCSGNYGYTETRPDGTIVVHAEHWNCSCL